MRAAVERLGSQVIDSDSSSADESERLLEEARQESVRIIDEAREAANNLKMEAELARQDAYQSVERVRAEASASEAVSGAVVVEEGGLQGEVSPEISETAAGDIEQSATAATAEESADPDPIDGNADEDVDDDEDVPVEARPPARVSESRYSRKSAKLPRIGEDAGSVLSSMANLRKRMTVDDDD